jgi:histidine ammonia-lyase
LASHAGKTDPHQLDAPVQEVYSIRCMPQILGPIADTLASVRSCVETELNSVTDNPIVLWREQRTVHGGNFHGDYISLAVDELKIAMTKLTMLSERRINYLVNPNIPHPWPAFANLRTPGLNLGLQGLQFVATSTTAQSQTLAFPQYVHSISTNGDNQDVVSLGTDAALLAIRVIRNAYVVTAIEAVVLAQVVDCLGIEAQLCPASRRHYQAVRDIVPVIEADRAIGAEVERLAGWMQQASASCVYA